MTVVWVSQLGFENPEKRSDLEIGSSRSYFPDPFGSGESNLSVSCPDPAQYDATEVYWRATKLAGLKRMVQ